ncbi:hypothetical protein WG219_17485 [Ectopseudomonas mendocina]|uniref:Uncharacterized protein n=1 Tax=Ectopseudomonas mendocina TaxID=300 RepID=A0ABZ2RDG5_ECTME
MDYAAMRLIHATVLVMWLWGGTAQGFHRCGVAGLAELGSRDMDYAAMRLIHATVLVMWL